MRSVKLSSQSQSVQLNQQNQIVDHNIEYLARKTPLPNDIVFGQIKKYHKEHQLRQLGMQLITMNKDTKLSQRNFDKQKYNRYGFVILSLNAKDPSDVVGHYTYLYVEVEQSVVYMEYYDSFGVRKQDCTVRRLPIIIPIIQRFQNLYPSHRIHINCWHRNMQTGGIECGVYAIWFYLYRLRYDMKTTDKKMKAAKLNDQVCSESRIHLFGDVFKDHQKLRNYEKIWKKKHPGQRLYANIDDYVRQQLM